MQEQNIKNHARILPLYHYGAYILLLAAVAGSVIKLYRTWQTCLGGMLVPGILLCISLLLVLLTFYTRSFALRAQDRAIKAEESLRYFAITGNLPDNKLTVPQIVALRFAPNNEFPDLAHRAVAENMKPSEIKKAIKNWKGDYYRV